MACTAFSTQLAEVAEPPTEAPTQHALQGIELRYGSLERLVKQ